MSVWKAGPVGMRMLGLHVCRPLPYRHIDPTDTLSFWTSNGVHLWETPTRSHISDTTVFPRRCSSRLGWNQTCGWHRRRWSKLKRWSSVWFLTLTLLIANTSESLISRDKLGRVHSLWKAEYDSFLNLHFLLQPQIYVLLFDSLRGPKYGSFTRLSGIGESNAIKRVNSQSKIQWSNRITTIICNTRVFSQMMFKQWFSKRLAQIWYNPEGPLLEKTQIKRLWVCPGLVCQLDQGTCLWDKDSR